MSQFAAKLPAIMMVAVVSSALAAIVAPAATAAPAECLAAPKGAPPPGGHWNYRTDRATKKQCWYVKSAADSAAKLAAAATETPPQQDTPLPSGVANARAELPQSPPAVSSIISPTPLAAAPARLPTAAAPSIDAQPWTMTSRSQDRRVGITDAAPQVQLAAAADPAPEASAEPAQVIAETPVPAAAPPPDGGTPLWMLIAAIGGALAFAGVAVGAIMAFARPRRIERDGFFDAPPAWEQADRDHAEPAYPSPRELDLTPEHILEAEATAAPAAEPVGPELAPEQPVEEDRMNWVRIARERQQAAQASAEIEGLLALARGAATRG